MYPCIGIGWLPFMRFLKMVSSTWIIPAVRCVHGERARGKVSTQVLQFAPLSRFTGRVPSNRCQGMNGHSRRKKVEKDMGVGLTLLWNARSRRRPRKSLWRRRSHAVRVFHRHTRRGHPAERVLQRET